MIHSNHPFVPDEGDRDPLRRFRGRHAAGVSIVTSDHTPGPVGLTVSSLTVLEGDPGYAAAVIGPLSDLWGAVERSERFVVHLCQGSHRPLADVFAGLRPIPGGVFSNVEWAPSEWGPVLHGLPDRAFCSLERMEELGHTGLVVARIDRVELSDLTDPLVHFRGRYHQLG